MKPTDFSKSLTDFLAKHLPGERGASLHTITSYRDTFVLFISFMEHQKNIGVERLFLKDFTRDRILAFLTWLQAERKCSNATRNVRLAALHSFARFLQRTAPQHLYEWQEILAIKAIKTQTGVISYLTLEGIKLLLQQPDPLTKKGLRDLVMLALMYDSAARVQEVIDLTPSRIRLYKPFTIKLIGKGSKARIVPLMEQQVVHLKYYMEKNGLLESNKNQSPLFFNSRMEKLTRAGINYVLQYYAQKARRQHLISIPDKISCHSLRHSKAMHLLQAGVHLIYIRDILGHVSVTTTEIYARTDSKQKREAIEKSYQEVISNEIPMWTENHNLMEWLKSFQ